MNLENIKRLKEVIIMYKKNQIEEIKNLNFQENIEKILINMSEN
jgi:hypothetical protein